MKRLAVIIAAALILLSVSTTAFAVPSEGDHTGQSDTVSSQSSEVSAENTDQSESSSENTAPDEETSTVSQAEEASQESENTDMPSENSSNPAVSAQESQASAKSRIDIDKIKYATYNIKNVNMFIDIPSDMYVLTPGIPADSPALKAAGMTKKEAEESLSSSDTAIKAFSEDFSYDITVTMVKNKNTKEIGNISSLDDKQIQKLTDNLLRNEYATGCAKNKYNDVLFLTLNMEYTSDDGTKVYGIQQYTVINDANIIVTIQSKNEPLTNDLRALFNKVMSSVFFDSINEPSEDTTVSSDISGTMIQELDRRYLMIIAASIIAAAALAGIIIVAIKRRETIVAENPELAGKYYDDDERYYDDIEPDIDETEENSVSEEKEVFSNSRNDHPSNKEHTENKTTKLNSTAELSIPKNPYTPVGKAEAKAQPALSVTSEIAKFSIINAEANRLAGQTPSKDKQEDAVVFAESSPKPRTSIEQIGESVFDKKAEPQKPVSEYERKFGKNRNTVNPKSYELPEGNTEQSNTPKENKEISKFEKRFGKMQPADAAATASTADLAEVKPVGELNIAPMITARNLKPENNPANLAKNNSIEEKDENLAYLDENMPQSEFKLKIVNPIRPDTNTQEKPAEKTTNSSSESSDSGQNHYSPESVRDSEIVVRDVNETKNDFFPKEIESADENTNIDDYLDGSGDEDNEVSFLNVKIPSDDNLTEISNNETKLGNLKLEPENDDQSDILKTKSDFSAAESGQEMTDEEKAEIEKKKFEEHINAPAETEELTEHVDTSVKEDFLKPAQPKKKTGEIQETSKEPEFAEKEPAEPEEDTEPTFFSKLKNKIFDAGETDSIYVTEIPEPEINKNSTKSFLDKIKDKLKNPLPDENGESPEMEEFFSDITPESTDGSETEKSDEGNENTENDDEKFNAESGELFRSKKQGDKFEIGIIKGKDGNIVINSVSDPNGNPLPIEIKDGTTELKSKEEEVTSETGTAESEEKTQTEPNAEPEKEENSSADSTEKISEEPQQPTKKGKKSRRKKKKNKNINAPIATAASVEAADVPTGVQAAAALSAGTAAKITETAAESAAETAGKAAQAAVETAEKAAQVAVEAVKNSDELSNKTDKKEETADIGKTNTVSDITDHPSSTTAHDRQDEEENKKESASASSDTEQKQDKLQSEKPAEVTESVINEAEKTPDADPVKETSLQSEEKESSSESEKTEQITEPDTARKEQSVTDKEYQPEENSAAQTESDDAHEKDKSALDEVKENKDEKTVSEPEEPPFIFERDSGIVFELPDTFFASPVEPRNEYLTIIPSLESVNADEYNKIMEDIFSGKIDPDTLVNQESGQSAANAPDVTEAPVDPEAAQDKLPEKAKETASAQNRLSPETKNPESAEKNTADNPGENDEEHTPDPFGPGSEEIPLKDLEAKNDEKIGSKLKKSIGKLFVTADGEEE